MSTGLDEVTALLQHTTVGELIELAIRSQGGEAERLGEPGAAFRKEGENWVLRFDGKTVHLKHRIGLEYLAYLLHRSGESVPVMALHLAVIGRPRRPAAQVRWPDAINGDASTAWQTPGSGTAEVLADARALGECRRRLHDLDAELRDAEARNDEAERLALRAEREKLEQYLGACSGPNGQLRRVADVRERVRKSVSNAITRAVSAVSKQHDVLGRHLRNSIRTGSNVTYDPEQPVDWQL